MQVYQSPIVAAITAFYGNVLTDIAGVSVREHLSAIAQKLYRGLLTKEYCLYAEINNYHPDFLGVPRTKLTDREFSLEDCRHTIAREYGFSSWENVEEMQNVFYNLAFEEAVNATIHGNLEQLKFLLRKDPSLIHTNSTYGHQATLLHYVGSNGVELWRQKVPSNIVEIATLLLESGANIGATMRVYGGRYSTLQLMESSAHPHAAGVAQDLALVLKSRS